MKPKHSQEIQTEALKTAKSIQKPNQTKDQTKLIAQGIEKGIAEYKKQQSKKSRERDKAKKSLLKEKNNLENEIINNAEKTSSESKIAPLLPWILLGLSWAVFFFYNQYFK
ncbi:MAG: DUF2956 domain-containing protein [Colwellia sp.]|nr:DUF2956 domain-containing protein [Colwellia sp.]